ncbi:ABC transporter permease [Thermomicrobium sp. 4228-Ro]|uniref:ABC transporter permease n=1 Tax=Thermomicrobium sp. 4228-Ro TaxID=2993937 RepID=UPI0022491018|nr:ABC transporter permease [Thermomicrobium sp. 4228-Ro]MCX2728227.1 ABC transporter permease [Thermomicrobium sp. 4228-Ro]
MLVTGAVQPQVTVRGHTARRRPGGGVRTGRLALFVPVIALLALLLLPLIALLIRAAGIEGIQRYARDPFFLDALRLTVLTSSITVGLALLFGTPVAWILARWDFPGRRLVELAVGLPVVLPPIVAGVALLMLFGRMGLLGQYLTAFGIQIPFTTTAVVIAQVFTATPFYIRTALEGFASVPVELEEAAQVDGCSAQDAFRRVTLPLALPALVSGATLCWAKAVSEFGATLLFAGNFQGRTQTISLAIWTAMEADLWEAVAMAAMLLVVSLAVFIVAERLQGAREVT